jgi:hypothetical protein
MTGFPNVPPRLLQRITLDSLAVAIATAFVALVVLGILPRVLSLPA